MYFCIKLQNPINKDFWLDLPQIRDYNINRVKTKQTEVQIMSKIKTDVHNGLLAYGYHTTDDNIAIAPLFGDDYRVYLDGEFFGIWDSLKKTFTA